MNLSQMQKGPGQSLAPTDRGFVITYAAYTQESLEVGEAAESGIYAVHSCEKDDESDRAAPYKAADYLKSRGATYPSSRTGKDGFYTTNFSEPDFRNGVHTEYQYHPQNWSEAELKLIFTLVKINR